MRIVAAFAVTAATLTSCTPPARRGPIIRGARATTPTPTTVASRRGSSPGDGQRRWRDLSGERDAAAVRGVARERQAQSPTHVLGALTIMVERAVRLRAGIAGPRLYPAAVSFQTLCLIEKILEQPWKNIASDTTSFAKVYPLLRCEKEEGTHENRGPSGHLLVDGLRSEWPGSPARRGRPTFETLEGAAKPISFLASIKGVVLVVSASIKEPTMRKIRYLDKLIDESAKGKAMEKILRKT